MLLEYKIIPEYYFPIFADSLFCDLTPKSRESLNKIKKTRRFAKGDCFFSRGDVPVCIYLLRAGKAQLLLNDDAKNVRITRLIEPDELLGLTEIIINLPYETDAKTITPCTCECIGREDFISFLHGEPEVCFQLLRLLSLNLQKSFQSFSSTN